MLLPSESQDLINIEQLSQRIGISVRTIYNRISNPATRDSMPPRTYVPGCKKLLFRTTHVAVWLESLAFGYTTAKGMTAVEAPKRARGRPRKSEALARQLYAQSAN